MLIIICMIIMALLIVGLIGAAIGLYKYMKIIHKAMESYTLAFNEYTALVQRNNEINDRIDADVKNLNAMLLGPMMSMTAPKNTSWS